MKAESDLRDCFLPSFKKYIMTTTQMNTKYVEWFSADEMHKHAQGWLSELEFVKDEHLFFEDLVKTYTLQLIETKKFSENKEIIDAINRSQKRNHLLIEAIKVHSNELEIMVDGIDQPKEEESYKKEHRNLIILVSDFLKEYRTLKSQLFSLFEDILKKEKQQRLLDKR